MGNYRKKDYKLLRCVHLREGKDYIKSKDFQGNLYNLNHPSTYRGGGFFFYKEVWFIILKMSFQKLLSITIFSVLL